MLFRNGRLINMFGPLKHFLNLESFSGGPQPHFIIFIVAQICALDGQRINIGTTDAPETLKYVD